MEIMRDLIFYVYSSDMGDVYVSLLEFLSFFVLILNLIFLSYTLKRFSSVGVFFLWLFVVVMCLLKISHFYTIMTGLWPSSLYRFNYGLAAFLPVLIMYAYMFLYGGIGKWFTKISHLYFGVIGLYFIYTVVTSPVKDFLLTSPHIGGDVIGDLPRMVHPLLTIPAFLLVIFFTVRYIWRMGIQGDAVAIFLSILLYSLGGVFLRFGAIEMFHLLDMFGSIVLLIGVYYLITALSKKELEKIINGYSLRK